MRRTRFHLLPLASLLILATPRIAAAQYGVLAAGAGISSIHSPDAGASRLAPLLHARAAWAVSRLVQVGVEVGAHDPFGRYPTTGGIAEDSLAVVARAQPVLRTTSLLASVQVGAESGVYVRTGIGLSRHDFRVFMPEVEGRYTAAISHEAGPAAGVAIGRTLLLAGFPLQVEAVGLLSHGEDSSGSRWAVGVQVVHALRLGGR
jgi:hypothetical protein